MKRILIMFIIICMSICLFSCSNSNNNQEELDNDKTISIITTIYPIYDWVLNIVDGSNVEVNYLMKNGSDLHNYQPTAQDIISIIDSDLFIYVGGESDEWVMDVLEDKKINYLNLLEVLKDYIKVEEHIEGMQEDEDHEHEKEHEHEEEFDEHVWLSLKNAQVVCDAIYEKISSLDPDNKNLYETNLKEYKEKLVALDKEYETVIQNSTRDTVLFGDRFPFRYLFDDYGLKYYAAFAGCSAETEASFETVAFLSEKTNELDLNYVLCIENGNNKIAEAIINNSNNNERKVLALNSMQSIADDSKTYIDIMKENLGVLKEVLN